MISSYLKLYGISVFAVSCFAYWAMAAPLVQPEVRVVFIGDSITAGYGVLKNESFPEKLEQILSPDEAKKNIKLSVINAGVAGSLSSSAVSRVKFYLKFKPDIFVFELGGNDALKGTEPKVIQKNLGEAIDLAQKNKVLVLILGMEIYSNFGEKYSKSFAKVFADLAREKKVQLMPFLLEDVALDKTRMQADQKHPNSLGHKIIAEHLIPYIAPMIASSVHKN